MAAVADVIIRTIFVIAASVWIGGLAVLPVIARVTSGTLSPADRIATFRRIGRVYGPIGGVCLVVALVLGAVLAGGSIPSTAFGLACIVAACLLAVTLVGVLQARAMTHLRSSARDESSTSETSRRVARAGQRATILRTALVVLTLTLVVLGSVLATSA